MPITVDELRMIVERHCGEKVLYYASNGRRKAKGAAAVIESVYPNLFTLHLDEPDTVISFRYTDLLTGDVEITVCESGKPLF